MQGFNSLHETRGAPSVTGPLLFSEYLQTEPPPNSSISVSLQYGKNHGYRLWQQAHWPRRY